MPREMEFGVVLMQQGRPLAFENRPLKGKNLHKPICEKEMMEILHALKKWHPYLIGRHFKVKTDHDSLKSVAALYTPLGDVEEIFNPLGVSLGASES
jgi:hypothetical protein